MRVVPVVGSYRRWMAEIERDWLGTSSAPPRDVIRAALASGLWRPSAQLPFGSAYCPRCASGVGPGEYSPESGCASCRDRRFPWKRIVRLGAYYGPLREWIHDLKFSRWEAMGVALGEMLGGAITELAIDVDVVTPAPMTRRRRIRRGVDHAEVIARAVARRIDRPMVHLLRRQARPPQWTKPVSSRRGNVRGAFRPARAARFVAPRSCRVLLVDDVTTSRSTIIEMTRALRRLDLGEVTVAVIAAADPNRRRGTSPQGEDAESGVDDSLRGG